KELLGADLEVETDQPPPDMLKDYFKRLGGKQSTIIEFPSMVFFPGTEDARLANVRALRGNFPYYGTIKTHPAAAAQKIRSAPAALVDQTLLSQFGLAVGDSVKVGRQTLPIQGAIIEVPGESAATAMIGPRVFIPQTVLDSTNLIQRGSRIKYKQYFKFSYKRDIGLITARIDTLEDQLGIDIDYETVEKRQKEIGEAISNLGRFLNLVGFIALLLGGIGVASSIHVYINKKISTASVLQCFGASSDQTMGIFVIQAVVLGFLGALAGTVLGIGIQYLLPSLVGDFLPLDIQLTTSWLAIGMGLFTGTGVALIFALLPLMALRRVSPLYALRTINQPVTALLERKVKVIVYALITITIFGYAILLTQSWHVAAVFTIGIIGAFGLLLVVAKLLMQTVRQFFPSDWSYVWRQGLANLYRPQNQTSTLMLSLGMGVLLVSTLYFSQGMLMEELSFASRENAPNLIFFDVQPDQNERLNQLLENKSLPVLQNVPMVTMRLDSLRGRSARAIADDSTNEVHSWALEHEYRSTYRDSLIDS